ncbi:hypothetical protein GQ54DRAFT_295191 [Martensiomyces pterosporus]|nr:hypothetical protein GQ54DRAFT_295191 [Martensiomyces pterosporus]
MGSGDLNMKKSWHPLTLANQRRVAEEKRKAEEEAQRTAKMQKELREERQREEIERLSASTNGTKRKTNQLEWMYNAPSSSTQVDEDLEAYLLGKKDIRSIIKQKEDEEEKTSRPEEKWKGGLFSLSNRNANSERDTMAKSMEDPLMDIQRREQAAIQAVLNNPLHVKDAKKRQKREERHKEKSRSKSDRHSKDKHGEKSSHRRPLRESERSADKDNHRDHRRHSSSRHGEQHERSRGEQHEGTDRGHRESRHKESRHRSSGRSRSPPRRARRERSPSRAKAATPLR